MAPILEVPTILERLAALPTEVYPPGHTVLAEGASTGRLLILREGAVEVVKAGVRIERVDAPGAVFGELSALLGKPHGADVRTLEPTTFHVTHATTFLRVDPTAALYVALVLAERLDATNHALVQLRHQLDDPTETRSALAETIDTIARTLRYGGPPL